MQVFSTIYGAQSKTKTKSNYFKYSIGHHTVQKTAGWRLQFALHHDAKARNKCRTSQATN